MQSARQVLFGDDVLVDIHPPVQSIRRQCEQEARGKLLHLREILMETALKPRHLKQAMILSVPSFIRIGRHVLRLMDHPHIVHTQEVIEELRKATELQLKGLETAWRIRTGAEKPTRGEIARLFETYLNDTMAITHFVDTMEVS